MSYSDTLMRTNQQLDAVRRRVAFRYSLARWIVRVVRMCLHATKSEAERRRALAEGAAGVSLSLVSIHPKVVLRDNRTRVLYESMGGLAWYEVHTKVRARVGIETRLCARYELLGIDKLRRTSEPPPSANV